MAIVSRVLLWTYDCGGYLHRGADGDIILRCRILFGISPNRGGTKPFRLAPALNCNRALRFCGRWTPKCRSLTPFNSCLALIDNCLASNYKCLASTDNCLASNYKCLASTDNCLASTDRCLASTDNCLASTDCSLASTDCCLTSTDRCLASTDRCLASTDRRLASTDRCLASTDRRLTRNHVRMPSSRPRVEAMGERFVCKKSRSSSDRKSLPKASTRGRDGGIKGLPMDGA
jgi:hypothetical protein